MLSHTTVKIMLTLGIDVRDYPLLRGIISLIMIMMRCGSLAEADVGMLQRDHRIVEVMQKMLVYEQACIYVRGDEKDVES